MAYSVVIHYATAGSDTIAINPVQSAVMRPVRNENDEPGLVIAVEEEWTLEALIHNVADPPATWAALRAKLASVTDPPNRVEIQRNGGTFREIRTTTHERFSVVALEEPNTGERGERSSQEPFVLRVNGWVKRTTAVIVRASLAFEYDESGLSIRRWRGEVQTPTGTSAQAQARSLGTLALPSSAWLNGTNGPEGLNVRVLDGDRDTSAEWEAVAREFGIAPNAGLGDFDFVVETSRNKDGEQVTRHLVFAAGPGAINAVRARRPTSVTNFVESENFTRRTARGEYVIEGASDADSGGRGEARIKRRFRIIGFAHGGLALFAISGDFDPVIQRGGRTGYEIIDEIEVTGTNVGSFDDLDLPVVLDALRDFQDGPAREEVPIEVISRGVSAELDRYRRVVTRRFKVPSPTLIDELYEPMLQAVLQAASSTEKIEGGGIPGALSGAFFGTVAGGFPGLRLVIDPAREL